jgi:hypothetical protein
MTPTPAAQRMRRYRERRKAGAVLVELECPPDAIDSLVAHGWPDPARRDDRGAIGEAVCGLVNAAGRARLRPA